MATVALLAACADKEPYRRTDVWYPTGANDANMAAMAANPNDLVHGRRNTAWSNAAPATLAIDRLQIDHPKALIGGTASSGGGASSAAGSTN